MAESPHLTYRLTDERKLRLAILRQQLHVAPGGKRVHGQLTDAQIIDWSLEAMAVKLGIDVFTEREALHAAANPPVDE
jgi:hypothetical protein